MGLGTGLFGGYETAPGTSGWGPVADGDMYGRNLKRQKWDGFGNNFTSAFNAVGKSQGWLDQRKQDQSGFFPYAQGFGGKSGGGYQKTGNNSGVYTHPGQDYQIMHGGQGGGGSSGGSKIANAALGAGMGFIKGGPVGAVIGGIGSLFG